jgi:hypothetical protein
MNCPLLLDPICPVAGFDGVRFGALMSLTPFAPMEN